MPSGERDDQFAVRGRLCTRDSVWMLHQLSRLATAITIPVTNASKQENSTISLRSTRILAPCPSAASDQLG